MLNALSLSFNSLKPTLPSEHSQTLTFSTLIIYIFISKAKKESAVSLLKNLLLQLIQVENLWIFKEVRGNDYQD